MDKIKQDLAIALCAAGKALAFQNNHLVRQAMGNMNNAVNAGFRSQCAGLKRIGISRPAGA